MFGWRAFPPLSVLAPFGGGDFLAMELLLRIDGNTVRAPRYGAPGMIGRRPKERKRNCPRSASVKLPKRGTARVRHLSGFARHHGPEQE
jgi:hypothetical protein